MCLSDIFDRLLNAAPSIPCGIHQHHLFKAVRKSEKKDVCILARLYKYSMKYMHCAITFLHVLELGIPAFASAPSAATVNTASH